MTDSEYLAFVCSTASGDDAGVYSYELDAASGRLTARTSTAVEKPTYLATHPNGEYLYTTNRTSGGVVTAFRIDHDSGELSQLNRQSSGGKGPCYISVDPAGRYAFVANYDAGCVSVLPLTDDGRLGEPSDVVFHEGSSVHPERQTRPHPHCIVPGPRGQFVYVPDLGTDRIVVYRLDAEQGLLRPENHLDVAASAGAGPRHLAFDAAGEFAYLVNELDSTLVAFAYDEETGALEWVDAASTVPTDADTNTNTTADADADTTADADNSCADVHVHPSNRWVYASNRGHDSIAVFEGVESGGELRLVGNESSGGGNPRDFVLDPSGRTLLAENRDSGTLVCFTIDTETGELTPTGTERAVPKPTCAVVVPRA